ncbi:MAG TPA: AbrB/MazE/SpoVT family DNA-binding domain-containing protein [Candidatus Nanoarchaeia archaeon]|nr:AbrB/MazE/SpoVT family DNA-binding domain-containing protein [Candidatus Nanoarchaeia archaeon]
MGLIEMRTATITEKGQVVIPKELREIRGFKEGNKVVIMAYEDHLELRPLSQVSGVLHSRKKIPETMLLSEKSLAKEWLTSKEDKAWKNL